MSAIEAYAAGFLGGATSYLLIVLLSGKTNQAAQKFEQFVYPTGTPPTPVKGKRAPKIRDDHAAIEMESKKIANRP